MRRAKLGHILYSSCGFLYISRLKKKKGKNVHKTHRRKRSKVISRGLFVKLIRFLLVAGIAETERRRYESPRRRSKILRGILKLYEMKCGCRLIIDWVCGSVNKLSLLKYKKFWGLRFFVA